MARCSGLRDMCRTTQTASAPSGERPAARGSTAMFQLMHEPLHELLHERSAPTSHIISHPQPLPACPVPYRPLLRSQLPRGLTSLDLCGMPPPESDPAGKLK